MTNAQVEYKYSSYGWNFILGNELNLIRRKKNTSDVVGNLNSSMSFCHCKSIGYRLHCLTKHDSGGQMVLEIRYEELDNVNKAYFTVFPWLSVTVIQMQPYDFNFRQSTWLVPPPFMLVERKWPCGTDPDHNQRKRESQRQAKRVCQMGCQMLSFVAVGLRLSTQSH